MRPVTTAIDVSAGGACHTRGHTIRYTKNYTTTADANSQNAVIRDGNAYA
jgi:hypothetical protein